MVDLLTGALLMNWANRIALDGKPARPDRTEMDSWERVTGINGEAHLKSGFDAYVFEEYSFDNDGQIVVCILGQFFWTLRDMKAIIRRKPPKILRKLFGMRPRLDPEGLVWLNHHVFGIYNGRKITLIGHSGGGAYASWAAWQNDCESICFNSARVGFPGGWSFKNDGKKQRVVGIVGDKWGDPNYKNGKWGKPLPGSHRMLRLPKSVRPGMKHFMIAIVAALDDEAGD